MYVCARARACVRVCVCVGGWVCKIILVFWVLPKMCFILEFRILLTCEKLVLMHFGETFLNTSWMIQVNAFYEFLMCEICTVSPGLVVTD